MVQISFIGHLHKTSAGSHGGPLGSITAGLEEAKLPILRDPGIAVKPGPTVINKIKYPSYVGPNTFAAPVLGGYKRQEQTSNGYHCDSYESQSRF
jgi:hypothetical protein